MSSIWPRNDPFRSAQAAQQGNGVSGIQVGYLVNDSSSTQLLRIWSIDLAGFTASTLVGFQAKGLTTAGGVRGVPIVTDEPVPPGVVVVTHLAALPGTTISPTVNWVASGLFNIFPIAVLRPGWAMGLADGNSATTDVIGVYFYWDWVYPDDIQTYSSQTQFQG